MSNIALKRALFLIGMVLILFVLLCLGSGIRGTSDGIVMMSHHAMFKAMWGLVLSLLSLTAYKIIKA